VRSSLQLRVVGFGLLKDGDVGIGVFSINESLRQPYPCDALLFFPLVSANRSMASQGRAFFAWSAMGNGCVANYELSNVASLTRNVTCRT
jgi:hypothetical protein